MESQQNSAMMSESDSAALTFLTESALRSQGSQERIPQAAKERLPAAIRAAQRQLWPARREEIMMAIDRLANFAEVFNIPADKLKAAAGIYSEALKHLPADLINAAINAATATHKYGMRLPLPAELIAHVSGEMAQRRRLLAKLEIMDRAPLEDAPDKPPPNREEIAKVDAALDELRGWAGRGRKMTIDAPTPASTERSMVVKQYPAGYEPRPPTVDVTATPEPNPQTLEQAESLS